MTWIISTFTIAIIASFLLGYHLRGMKNKIVELEEVVKSKVDKKVEPEEPKSRLIDPDDPIQEAIWKREQEMKRMNP